MCIVDGRKDQCLNIIIAIQGTFALWCNVIKLRKDVGKLHVLGVLANPKCLP